MFIMGSQRYLFIIATTFCVVLLHGRVANAGNQNKCHAEGAITMFLKNCLADIYYDGFLKVSAANPKAAFQFPPLPGKTRVIALKLTNFDRFGPGFVLSNSDGSIQSNGLTWKCTQTRPHSGWAMPEFDDSKWPAAVESWENTHMGKRPLPGGWGFIPSIKVTAVWIWAQKLLPAGPVDDQPVYCRTKVPPQRCDVYEVTGADIAEGSCLCVNKNATPFTDGVCSINNRGVENIGACFKYTGKHSVGPAQCKSLDGQFNYNTVNVIYKGKDAWVKSHHLDRYTDLSCK